MFMLAHVLRIARLVESVLDEEGIRGTKFLSNFNGLDDGLLERGNCHR